METDKDLMSIIQQMDESMAEIKIESAKFIHKGNASAGKRVRKLMQGLKVMAQESRKLIQESNNKK